MQRGKREETEKKKFIRREGNINNKKTEEKREIGLKRDQRGGGNGVGETKQLYDFISLWVALNLQRR